MRDPAEWKRQMDNYIRARNCASCVAWVLAYVVWTAVYVFLLLLLLAMATNLALVLAVLPIIVISAHRSIVILLYYSFLFILNIIIKKIYPPP